MYSYSHKVSVYIKLLKVSLSLTHTDRQADRQTDRQVTYGGLSHFLCLNWTPVPQVLLHMLHWLHELQSPSTCWGMGVLLTHSPALHHWHTQMKEISNTLHTYHSLYLGRSTVTLFQKLLSEINEGVSICAGGPTLSAPHSVPSRGGSSLVLQDASPSTKHHRPAHIRCWHTNTKNVIVK